LPDPPKFTQIKIFGSKINHLATLFSLLQLRKMIYSRAPDGKAKRARQCDQGQCCHLKNIFAEKIVNIFAEKIVNFDSDYWNLGGKNGRSIGFQERRQYFCQTFGENR
jgi:hypothetical protein